jgi:hypothetical protein
MLSQVEWMAEGYHPHSVSQQASPKGYDTFDNIKI